MAVRSRFWGAFVCFWAVVVALGGMVYTTLKAADDFTADPATGHARFGLLPGALEGADRAGVEVARVQLVHANGTLVPLGGGRALELGGPAAPGAWVSLANATVPAGNYTGFVLTFGPGSAEPSVAGVTAQALRPPVPLQVAHDFEVAPLGNLTLVARLDALVAPSAGAVDWQPSVAGVVTSPAGAPDWRDDAPLPPHLTP